MQQITADVVIIGAGIAGLWLHNRLNQMGFNALLLEHKTIGSGQTLSAQGIIHGGVKYALNGILSNASQAISTMPARWQACLAGKGDTDLTGANVLSRHQLLWSTGQLSAKMLAFFASKKLRGRIKAITKTDRPAIFQHAKFKGALYQLDEPVLDVTSVLASLAEPWQHRIIHIAEGSKIAWQQNKAGLQAVALGSNIQIRAQHFVLTAGEGNQTLMEKLGINKPVMQIRPLHMVLCKAKNSQQPLPKLYAHNLGSGSKPVATITSHIAEDGNIIWYIGGDIAEQGVGQSAIEVTRNTQQLLADILPWLKLPELEWATHVVNRAEPKQFKLTRPDTAFIKSSNNVHIAWPTKLALAPNLADKVITRLTEHKLHAQKHAFFMPLPPAKMGQPLWNNAFQ